MNPHCPKDLTPELSYITQASPLDHIGRQYIIRGGGLRLVKWHSARCLSMMNSYSVLEYSIETYEHKIFRYLSYISLIWKDPDPLMIPNWILIPMIRTMQYDLIMQFHKENPGYISGKPFRKKYGMDLVITALESLSSDILELLADQGYKIIPRMYHNIRDRYCFIDLCDPLIESLAKKRTGFVDPAVIRAIKLRRACKEK